MITSTIVVACRGARRWFDLDAVRHESSGQTRDYIGDKRASNVGNGNYGAIKGAYTAEMSAAGAPPLDWHHDQPEPGVIVIGEPPDDERDDPIALAVKIVDCMCPREVCTVCGVPRERIVDVQLVNAAGKPDARVGLRLADGGHMGNRVTETLGWTDCGHNAYRRGRVFDPYHNPAIEAACAILDRDYITP